jgi:hypothetical protein
LDPLRRHVKHPTTQGAQPAESGDAPTVQRLAIRYRTFAITWPFHDDTFWAQLKRDNPAEWADAVAFDTAIHNESARANADGHPLRGQFFVHRQLVPIDQVVLRPRPARAADADTSGCGPWTCPHPGEHVSADDNPISASAREVA